jgi:hypothetical protein
MLWASMTDTTFELRPLTVAISGARECWRAYEVMDLVQAVVPWSCLRRRFPATVDWPTVVPRPLSGACRRATDEGSISVSVLGVGRNLRDGKGAAGLYHPHRHAGSRRSSSR